MDLIRIRKILRKIFSKVPIFNRTFIVLMDGGICSQINQYLIGRLIEEKGNRVYYDLTFYRKKGRDADGLRKRNFDLLKLFPDLHFAQASSLFVFVWKLLFKRKKKEEEEEYDYLSENAPCYLDGYYRIPDEVFSILAQYDISIEECAIDKSILFGEGKRKYTCGIHVRRGDLSNGNIYYGRPATSVYYLNAIALIQKLYPETVFFFFSDDFTFVKNQIIPLLSNSVIYKLIEGNGDEKGYLDLALLSQCNFQISSVGSFGKYAYHLNKNREKGLVLMNTEESTRWIPTVKDNVWVVDM